MEGVQGAGAPKRAPGGGGSSLPPELPLVLASLELDQVTRNLSLNHEPLRAFLKKLMGYMRDSTARGLAEVRRDFEMEVSEAKKALSLYCEERTQDLEDRVQSDPRISSLEFEAQSLKSHLQTMESQTAKLNTRLTGLAEEIHRAVDEAFDKRPPPEPKSVARGYAFSSHTPQEALSRQTSPVMDHISDRLGELGQERRGSSKKDRGSMVGDLQGLTQKVKDLEEVVLGYQRQARLLEEKFDYEVDGLMARCDRAENNIKAREQSAESDGGRLSGLEAMHQRLAADFEAQSEVIRRLERTKAEAAAFERMELEVRTLGALAEKGAEVASLAPRVHNLEQVRRALDAASEQAKRDIEALRHAADDLGMRIEESASRSAEAWRRDQAVVAERCAALAAAHDRTVDRVKYAEASLGDMATVLKGLASKADLAEVRALRAALSDVAEELKDREQAVLFGARCLSCNRVFDDVERHAGVVNLRGERQRAQVFAEIQRALHSPRSDPLEPIKMLAVRVGRPCDLKSRSGLGPLAGRDALSLARGVEDVVLLPVPPGVSASPPVTARPRSSRQLMLAGSAPFELPALPLGGASAAAAGTPRPGATAAGRGNDAAAPTSVAATTSLAQLRDSQIKSGPMDYKHSITQLLGRADRGPPSPPRGDSPGARPPS